MSVSTSAWCTSRSIIAAATDVIGEGFSPVPERQVRGHQDGTDLVARGDELKEHVGRVLVEGDVTDFVDDDEVVAADLFQLSFQPVRVMRSARRAIQFEAVSNSTE